MKTFDELWKDIEERCQRWCIPIVQDKEELRHVFNLMKGSARYLEIGSAEGNSLYVLSHTLIEDGYIQSIDFGEKHTKAPRDEVTSKWGRYWEHLGNSHNVEASDIILSDVYNREAVFKFDCVLIDAGHTYEDVIADAIAYGHLATKYIFFHDIQLPEVRKAFDWYCAQNPQFKRSEFINSETFGYGILEV